MAKICPMTGEKVLYLECVDCDDRYACENKNISVDCNVNDTIDEQPIEKSSDKSK